MSRYVELSKSDLAARLRWVNGCWEWQYAVGTHGYGVLSRGRLAHRLAYELFIGPVPIGNIVCHTCDNRKCCNPEHLFLGTHSDNTQDMIRKGRHVTRTKLTNQQVCEIRTKLAEGATQTQIVKEYNISQAQVSRIKHNHQRKS